MNELPNRGCQMPIDLSAMIPSLSPLAHAGIDPDEALASGDAAGMLAARQAGVPYVPKSVEFDRKQLKFIDLCVHMEDPTRAAVGAGYPKEFGIQLYANPQIRAEIDRKKAIVSAKKAEILAERQITAKPRKLPKRPGSPPKR